MIHYHGLPLGGPHADWGRFLRGRHALVSFAYPESLPVAAEVCQSFIIDNGAFTAWRKGEKMDVQGYYEWVKEWREHPGFDFAIIPDVIDGSESDNMSAIAEWHSRHLYARGVPVWHLNESLDKLIAHVAAAENHVYEAVAFGSAGKYAQPATEAWWARMAEALDVICVNGRPRCRLHGLRMLSPAIIGRIPLRSADSTNAAQNNGLTRRFGMYPPPRAWQRSAVIADRVEAAECAAVWGRPEQTQEMLFA